MSSTPVFTASPEAIQKVAALLKSGEVVALPTETVYGLAGNATSPAAVLKIFTAKERPSFDPLIVHVSDQVLKAPQGPIRALIDQKIVSENVLSWPYLDHIESAMRKFWPGPLTFILPRGSLIPNEVTSGQETVGLRSPAHPLFQAVLSNLDFPLAAPSANRFGRISPTDSAHVMAELDGRIAGVLDGGPCSVGVESTIIRVEHPFKVSLLRPGKIGIRELEAHFGTRIEFNQTLGEKNQAQAAPGMLDEHYAPTKPLILIPVSFNEVASATQTLSAIPQEDGDAYLAMNRVPEFVRERKHSVLKSLSAQNSLNEMAQSLFATLRELDQDPRVKTIYCDIPTGQQDGLASAIRDRLKRASRNKPNL